MSEYERTKKAVQAYNEANSQKEDNMSEEIFETSTDSQGRTLFEIPYTAKLELSESNLCDVLTTALEGGYEWFSNYSSSIKRKISVDRDRSFSLRGIDDYLSYMAPAVGGTLTFKIMDHDETGKESEFVLTTDKLLKGIQMFITDNNPNGESYYENNIGGDVDDFLSSIDLNDADIILQLALFGDVIYG